MVRYGLARPVQFGHVGSRLITTLVTGTEASSTVRSGMNYGTSCSVEIRQVGGAIGQVPVRSVALRSVLLRPVEFSSGNKPPSWRHGGRSTRPWWDQVRFGDAVFARARPVDARSGKFCSVKVTYVRAEAVSGSFRKGLFGPQTTTRSARLRLRRRMVG